LTNRLSDDRILRALLPGSRALSHARLDVAVGRILVTFPGYPVDDPEIGGLLTSSGFDLQLAPKTGPRTPQEVIALIDGAVGAIVSTDPFDERVLRSATALRVVARVGVGIDTVDVEVATEAEIVVTTTPGLNEETVADHAVALMLAALRRVVEHDRSVRNGAWDRMGPLTGWDLHRARVGIVGYGRIGRAVARRLTGFKVELRATDPAVTADEGVRIVELDDLLQWADIVTLHLPGQPGRPPVIGRRELALLRPTAVVVNTARGGLIDEDALADALRTGRLRAAGLDVFEEEPPTGSPLVELDNVVLSPHIAGVSVQSVRAMTHHATRAVLDVLHGREPLGVVNPQALRPGSATRKGV
jgi:phosphoglycerate dehydrogenase-like enzyme